MRRRLALILIALFATISGARAEAVDDANAAVLAARDGNYTEAVRLFTLAINSGEMSYRGQAQALSLRGIARATTGDYPAARMDLDASVSLNSDYAADAYANRGYVELVTGQAAMAADDLDKSAGLRVWPYNVLWLYTARMKAGMPDTGEHALAALAMQIDLTRWPGPVVQFLLGRDDRTAVMAAANAGDAETRKSQLCDANFYIGEYDQAHKDAKNAGLLLQRSASDCPFGSFERIGAAAELARLK